MLVSCDFIDFSRQVNKAILIKVNFRKAISCIHMLAMEKAVRLCDSCIACVVLDIYSLIKVVNSSFTQLKRDLSVCSMSY